MTVAVVATAFGGPEVLSVVEITIGDPGPGEVLIKVEAIGTNPIDYKLYSGAFGSDPAQLPIRLGFEAAGVVLGLGDGAVGPAGPLHVGDEVIAYRITGAYAAEVLVPASSVLPKPSTLSFAEASGLMLTGTTAVHALAAVAVSSGDTVVVHGASGGVGLMAVELARSAGARVIGTASEGRHAYLRELGVEPVAYGDGLLERIRTLAPEGIDAAIDAVGTDEAIDVSLALVARRDRITTIAAYGRGPAEGIKLLGMAAGADPGTEIREAARMQLVRQAEEGGLHVLVAATYPLTEAPVALEELASGHTHGKIVLLP
jgi:NADPH:quinone reductase-like Zn-dependent oxidoreductase